MQGLRDHGESIVLMGKNTMMKRSIRLYCEKTGNDQWPGVIDSLVGNVGLIFTKGDLNEVRLVCAVSGMGCYLCRPSTRVHLPYVSVRGLLVLCIVRNSKSFCGCESWKEARPVYEQACLDPQLTLGVLATPGAGRV